MAPSPQGMPTLPPEDCFATAKRIRFIQECILRRRAQLGRPLTILDFGCGNATQMGQFLIDGIDTYVGFDIHKPSLDYARMHFTTGRASFVSCLPEGQRFDVVVVSEVLEHLDDPARTLTDLVTDRLCPDGIVLGSVPHGYGLTEVEKYVDQKLGLYNILRKVVRTARYVMGRQPDKAAITAPYNYESGHVQFFTRSQLRRVAAEAGLRLVTLRNGSVMGADLSGVTILRPRFMIHLNTRIADHVPHWAAATWFFLMERE